ncbi:MAG: DUF58 domain-containing protein [Gloeocapsa sp. DLM2.Bin57]|nr:MAG: DUF58 domain-containing protein [Gloeocapsa sp. DLM2.Bin57]
MREKIINSRIWNNPYHLHPTPYTLTPKDPFFLFQINVRNSLEKTTPKTTGNSLQEWLETRYCAPSFAGSVLGGIALCFFGAAINTMSGWLYVLSGMIISLLLVAAWLCLRSLRELKVTRSPIEPVTVEQELELELLIDNPTTSQSKQFFQVEDLLPIALTGSSASERMSVAEILPSSQYRLSYFTIPQRRGIYHWEEVFLRSGYPLGLFWCRRSYLVPARAIIYPAILPLNHCPLIDSVGDDDSALLESDRRYQAAQEGITKAIRDYRFGDPTRLIHWRSSARFSEFKVRELEIITSGENIIIALDTSDTWQEAKFEQAVTTAASLYAYASRRQLNVELWTNGTGLVKGFTGVLEALAAVEAEDTQVNLPSLSTSVVWLTQNPGSLHSLSTSSRWIFFTPDEHPVTPMSQLPGIVITAASNLELQQQLQQFQQR